MIGPNAHSHPTFSSGNERKRDVLLMHVKLEGAAKKTNDRMYKRLGNAHIKGPKGREEEPSLAEQGVDGKATLTVVPAEWANHMAF